MAVTRELTFTTSGVPPLVAINPDGPTEGIAVSLVERLFELADVDNKQLLHPAQRAFETAVKEPNTCMMPIERSQEREPRLTWVGPIAISRHALYSAPDEPMSLITLEDARHHRIVTYRGSGVADYLDTLDFNVHFTRTSELGLKMILADRAGLWAVDVLSAPIIAEQLDVTLDPPELVFFTNLRYVGCHRKTEPEIIQRLRDALSTMHDKDEVRAVLELEDL